MNDSPTVGLDLRKRKAAMHSARRFVTKMPERRPSRVFASRCAARDLLGRLGGVGVRLVRYWLTIGVFALNPPIAFAALWPGAAPPLANHADLAVHAALFGALALAAIHCMRQPWFACAGVLAYSLALEAAQGFVPGRDASLLDAAANAAGVAAAAALWLMARGGLGLLGDPVAVEARLGEPRKALHEVNGEVGP